MKRPGSASDPLWYKDAVIYEVHVKAFCDSNNDGIGDLQGLLQKLDYLQDLGVTCIWLLPFFPSPLKDDGYDIADYLSIHPSYGTLDDFEAFLEAAHQRGLQVMIELVVNHTSDQHPWFQAARQAPAGTPVRDFYVWSDSDQKYKDARIIFTDTEKSNWTWDPVAQAYYWHRFFSHQPDLNYDNPAVTEEILKVMRYWLDLGVDGLRLDAIPYLVERDGTNCENLPETHALIKAIRAEMDKGYDYRMILAEANQWPSDVRPYFGEGDECHMAFHFPLMPRIFMALRLEHRLPVIEIMGQTPPIPSSCQWGLFLRNHDELTLEMVSADERDYMYLAYSADPRMRLNIGIRRRLAPLMDNNRRRIELLNSLLFSFPGTPIMYYGDEIGMGDNIYLGDRNGVRTPMQWNGDRNAGFSRATPAKLYSPVIMDAVYGYEATNVEAQQSDPSSLLNWMRNMIALRKLFRVFGRGSLEFLDPANGKILAYLRRYEGEQVLCVANLSRFAQPVELDLSALEGMRPVEMLGYVDFPPITKHPYPLTLGPYGFLWFELHPLHEPAEIITSQPEVMNVAGGWEAVLEGSARESLENQIIPEFLVKQRWFGGKSRRIDAVSILDWAEIGASESALVIGQVRYEDDSSESYLIPLATGFGERAQELRSTTPNAILCTVASGTDFGVLYDATYDPRASLALLAVIGKEAEIHARKGTIAGSEGGAYAALREPDPQTLVPVRCPGEQSNTSIQFGDRLFLKLFRRLEAGPNPDCEIGKYLSERAHFENIPPFAGMIEYRRDGAEPTTLVMLQGLVANEGDGWKWNMEELDRYYEHCARIPFPGKEALGDAWYEPAASEISPLARETVGICLDAAGVLGRRTAEMHLALAASSGDPAFDPEPFGRREMERLAGDLHARTVQSFDKLMENLPRLPDSEVELAGLVLSRRRTFLEYFRGLQDFEPDSRRIRIHGHYHLGQLLRVKNDFVILDFEGEPSTALAERRTRQSPLKDVAGMLRSLSYAAYAALLAYTTRRPEDFERLEPWARLWENATSAEFLRVYRASTAGAALLPADPVPFQKLLMAYVLDQALYELRYELDNRLAWIRIPLSGLLSLEL